MKTLRTTLLATVALAVAAAVPAVPAAAQATPDSSRAVREILATARAVDSAWERGDRVLLDSLLASDFIDTDASGATTLRPDIFAFVVPPGDFTMTASQDDVRVSVHGDAAVLTARKTFRMRLGAQEALRPQRITDVYVRQGGRWRLATSHQSDFPPERQAARVDPTVYDDYVGVYEIDSARTVTVRRDGDRLMAQATGAPEVEYLPLSATEFFVRDWPAEMSVVFVRDASGAVVASTQRMYGLERVRRKIR